MGKIEQYKMLKDEIARMWGMKKVIVIPLVVGALGAMSADFEKYVAAIGIEMKVGHAQKTTSFERTRILGFVLGCYRKKAKNKIASKVS